MNKTREPYTMGYGKAATSIMAQRTAKSHAAFFLPNLSPGMSLLDCGCGPGTITLGFAELLAPGQVVGTEIESSQIEIARKNSEAHGTTNVRFEAASIYELPFDDASFDAVFVSAVLGNLHEPIRGLSEARRVLKPGGVIGVKEFDHGGDVIYPMLPGIRKFGDLYLRLRKGHGHDPDGGRRIGSYLHEAGFIEIELNARYDSMSGSDKLRGAAELNAGLLSEGWGNEFTSRGWASNEEIDEMGSAWRAFAEIPGALYAVTWCEATARNNASS